MVKPSEKMRLFATETLNPSMTATENSIVKARDVKQGSFWALLFPTCFIYCCALPLSSSPSRVIVVSQIAHAASCISTFALALSSDLNELAILSTL